MKPRAHFFGGLIGGAALVLLLYATAFYLNLGRPTESSRWCFEINQKKRAIASAINGRKLLLVGGSGTLFGIDAKEIQKQTGVPTVNLGTHAALGINYMLNEAKELAAPGDTVLLTFEYELYSDGELNVSTADELYIDYVIAREPAIFYKLPLSEQWKMFMLVSTKRLQKGFKSLGRAEEPEMRKGIYYSGNLDECGDQTRNNKTNRSTIAVAQLSSLTNVLATGLPTNLPAFGPIGAFCTWAQAHQVRVLATYPNLAARPEYYLPLARAGALRIREDFAKLNVPVLGSYTNAILPADWFFDTHYHLIDEASLARTQTLLSDLKPYLR